jgi:hypothetical protein
MDYMEAIREKKRKTWAQKTKEDMEVIREKQRKTKAQKTKEQREAIKEKQRKTRVQNKEKALTQEMKEKLKAAIEQNIAEIGFQRKPQAKMKMTEEEPIRKKRANAWAKWEKMTEKEQAAITEKEQETEKEIGEKGQLSSPFLSDLWNSTEQEPEPIRKKRAWEKWEKWNSEDPTELLSELGMVVTDEPSTSNEPFKEAVERDDYFPPPLPEENFQEEDFFLELLSLENLTK